MRFIDLKKLYVPTEWAPEAKALLANLRKMSPSERSDAWKDEDYQLWPMMKQLLAGLSHQKCWYSEEFVSGAKGDVDHFRPKGKLAGVKADHSGYWWVALECSNLRFSCQTSNRLYKDTLTGEVMGKGAFFPLLDEGSRVCAEKSPLDSEDYLLLDPTRKGDPDLLWFEESGRAVPQKTEQKDKKGYLRAKESINRYHLNDKELLFRRGRICEEVKKRCEKIQRLELKPKKVDLAARRRVLELKLEIADLIQPYSPFSAAAIATLKGYQSSPAVKELLASIKNS